MSDTIFRAAIDHDAVVKVGAALSRLGRATVPELRASAMGDGRLHGRRFDRALVALIADGRVRADGGVLELIPDDSTRETTT